MNVLLLLIIFVVNSFSTSNEEEIRLDCEFNSATSTCKFRNVIWDSKLDTPVLIVETAKENVLGVIFEDSEMLEIPPIIFRDFENLRVLEVRRSSIAFLNDLNNCLSLTNFTMQGLSSVYNENSVFRECRNLLSIGIESANEGFNFAPEVFIGLNNLVSLSLEALLEVPENLLNSLVNLESLKLKILSTKIPEFIFKNTKKLQVIDLSSNNLPEIYGSCFHNLKNLQILDLSFNSFTSINDTNFVNLPNLEVLRLHSNQITKISDKAFESPKSLLHLSLSGNKIGTLTKNFLLNMNHVEHFVLTRSEVKQIESLGNCKVSHLQLDFNLIESFRPSTFQNCSALRRLNLIRNQIQELNDESFAGLENLGRLDLTDNPNLKKLPNKIFENLKNLEFLSLMQLNLLDLPEEIFEKNLKLTNLHLAFNNLKVISNRLLRNNIQLKTLDLRANHIIVIGARLFEITPNLNVLNLERNFCVNRNFFDVQRNLEKVRKQLVPCHPIQINVNCNFEQTELGYSCVVRDFDWDLNLFEAAGDHLPGKFNVDVEAVKFENSFLHSIPQEIFLEFVNLKHLDVHATGVRNLKALTACGILETLNLSSNKIPNIQAEAFHNCSKLKSIDLSKNQLERIQAKLFNQNLNLESINLSSNQIKAVEPCKFLKNLNLLKKINFLDNLCVSKDFDIERECDIGTVQMNLMDCFSDWYHST